MCFTIVDLQSAITDRTLKYVNRYTIIYHTTGGTMRMIPPPRSVYITADTSCDAGNKLLAVAFAIATTWLPPDLATAMGDARTIVKIEK